MDLFVIVQALWLFLPGYVANMAPVFAMKILPRWNARIDGGRNGRDGRPLLGPGKTWRGLVAGVLFGAAFALAQSLYQPRGWDVSDFGRSASGSVGVPVILGAAFGLGVIVGDATKSYFKRRTGRQGGAPWVPFDQLDFVVGGLAFLSIAALIVHWVGATPENWFGQEFLGPRWPVLVVLMLLTPLLHFVVNVIGYGLRLKKVPW